MEDWSRVFGGKRIITDLGASQTMDLNGEQIELGRYAVFHPNKGCEGHHAVEVGSDLEVLCKKHGVARENVCVLSEG